ncbi:MAG TPA: MFS transporter [Pseudonocardiaceae bacterium]|nr:MFS transporter [Pseudonocardiaceae bacterium]
MTTTTAADAGFRGNRLAVAGMFLLIGIMLGTWYARLPQVRTELGLSDGGLAVVLLTQTVGVLIAMQVASPLTQRFGSRAVIRVTSVLVPWFPLVTVLMPNAVAAGGVLLGWGLVAGLLDVNINAQGVRVEELARKPILNRLHAVWGIGSLLGSVLTVLADRLNIAMSVQFLVIAAVLTLIALLSGRGLRADTVVAQRKSRPGLRAGWTRAIVLLGLIGAAAALCESAVSTWCGIFLTEQRAAPAGLASLGYTAFILAETSTRLIGDRLHGRVGAVALVRAAMATTVLGIGLTVLVPSAWLDIVGFAIQGCGLAVLIPIITGAVGHGATGGGQSASVAIARYSTLYYGGIVAGPSLLGWLSQALGVSTALTLLVMPLAAIGLLAKVTAPASRITARAG